MRLVVGLLHHQGVTLSTSEPPSHVPVVTFFNNKGGVGKTSLVYHLSWMLKRIGRRVLAVDLDPQANLTSAFLSDARLERLWLADSEGEATTIYRSIIPLMEARPMKPPALVALGSSHHSNDYDIELEGRGPSGLALIPGDLELASFEEILNQEWPNALSSGSPVAYRANQVLSSLWSVIQRGARAMSADLVLADVGPSLGAINRAALIATDFVVVPLGGPVFPAGVEESRKDPQDLEPRMVRSRAELECIGREESPGIALGADEAPWVRGPAACCAPESAGQGLRPLGPTNPR